MNDQAVLGADGTQKYSKDKEIEGQIEAHVKRFGLSSIELINNFPVYARRTTLKRFLAHYELFRQTITLPGDIVELGVFRGSSLMTWANFLEARNIGDRTKKIWGFDNFKGFGDLSPEDGPEYEHLQKQAGGFSPASYLDELTEAIRIFDNDRFVPWKKRVELIVGDVEQTVPAFVEEHPGLRISLLHFDIDLYKPTIAGLKSFFPRVVPGGVVIFDEYGVLEWGGESSAVEEYLAGEGYRINKFEWNNIPGGYLIKK
jgi:Macrocin-O-methyltransferase (TylF)